MLDACLRNGIYLPYACGHGLCGTCKVNVIDGEVDLGDASPFALLDFERAEGSALACCARLHSDATIEADVDEEPDALRYPICDVTGIVTEITRPTGDIAILSIALPAPGLSFQAGQYVNVTIPAAAVRVPSRSQARLRDRRRSSSTFGACPAAPEPATFTTLFGRRRQSPPERAVRAVLCPALHECAAGVHRGRFGAFESKINGARSARDGVHRADHALPRCAHDRRRVLSRRLHVARRTARKLHLCPRALTARRLEHVDGRAGFRSRCGREAFRGQFQRLECVSVRAAASNWRLDSALPSTRSAYYGRKTFLRCPRPRRARYPRLMGPQSPKTPRVFPILILMKKERRRRRMSRKCGL